MRPRIDELLYQEFKEFKKLKDEIEQKENQNNNVLIIGDIHAPFVKKGYLEHCQQVYESLNCNKVVFIGDIIDNHYSSYHEVDNDALGGRQELNQAIEVLNSWYEVFPFATVILGNHDYLVMRKAQTGNISKEWLKDFGEVLQVPNWNFVNEYILDGVLYQHGTGTSGANAAFNSMLHKGLSVVQGHIHTEASIRFNVTNTNRSFGMQVGCGVDQKAYAMNYAKNFTKKMMISCAAVLNNGKIPVILPMEL